MSYINSYGTSIGPIQIEPSGTWIKNEQIKIGLDEKITNHLTFSLSQNSYDNEHLTILSAKTPLIGGKVDKDTGEYIFYCDPNSLVTAAWVAGFATLKPGEQQLDLSAFATQNDLKALRLQVNQNVNDINLNKVDINQLRKDFTSYVDDPFPNTMVLDCKNASYSF